MIHHGIKASLSTASGISFPKTFFDINFYLDSNLAKGALALSKTQILILNMR